MPPPSSATTSVALPTEALAIDCGPTPVESHGLVLPLRPGDVLQGRRRYQILRQLGQGGFGTVYVAASLDTSTDAPGLPGPPAQVAVKVLGSARDPGVRSGLKRELAALRAIEHEHIPKLYDWSLDGDVAFAVVEYFPSGSLREAWPDLHHSDAEQTWRLLLDLLSALEAAHRASVLHLDVKPSNVLLDGNGGFVLADFGTAQSARMSMGLLSRGGIGVGLGTRGYRTPEQDQRSLTAIDLRTDLYGLGATAWAIYTGIDLNSRTDELLWNETGRSFALRPISEVRAHCPPDLERVIMSLLHVDPQRRPGGASEVLVEVRQALEGFSDPVSSDLVQAQKCSRDEIQSVLDGLIDPLWSSLCCSVGFERYFVRFDDGELLSRGGHHTHHTILVLQGRVAVEREGERVGIQEGEGALLGSIATLTGASLQVDLRAVGTVWACVFNEAQLEQLVTCNPGVSVRMLRNMADRIATGPPRHRP